MSSRLRGVFDVPRFNREYDGGIAADDDANAGLAAVAGDGDGSVNAPKNALTNAFVRILSGTSSRMNENVRRWSIRLSSIISHRVISEHARTSITSRC